MKKSIFFVIAALCLVGCKSTQDEPQAAQQVTFTVTNFSATTESLTAQAPSSLIDGEEALTDLYLFDGSTQLAHQTSGQQDFGTISVMLSLGDHNLHFIATRSTGLGVSNGVLTCSSLRNTFGKTVALNVSGSSEENITLDRLTGKLIITIDDAIPTGAANLHIAIGNRYTSLDVQTLYGVSPEASAFDIDLTSKVGNTGYSISLWMLAPDADGYETTYTLTATNGSQQVIGSATGTMTIAPNTKTLLHGSLFTGTRSFVSLNTSWNADIEESF